MELQNHSIKQRTAHYTETQHIHCTYDTEEPLNQSRGRTREPSPWLWNHRTTALQKELHITQRHNTYSVLKILRNHWTKVVVELENLALNYETAEPQQHKKNCTLQRHNTYTVLTIPRNHRAKVVVELENLALNYGTAEPQHYKENCTLHRDTIHTLYLRYWGTTEPKSWQN